MVPRVLNQYTTSKLSLSNCTGKPVKGRIHLIHPPTYNRIKAKNYKSLVLQKQRIFRCLTKWSKQKYCETFGKPSPQTCFKPQSWKMQSKQRLSREPNRIVFSYCASLNVCVNKDQTIGQ